MAWALGERLMTPSIPDNGPEQLDTAFRLLTGHDAPATP
jgi:hypothetical protein